MWRGVITTSGRIITKIENHCLWRSLAIQMALVFNKTASVPQCGWQKYKSDWIRWISVLTTTHCNKKVLWTRLRTASVCGCKDNYLASRKIKIGSLPWLTTSLTKFFGNVNFTNYEFSPLEQVEFYQESTPMKKSLHYCTLWFIIPRRLFWVLKGRRWHKGSSNV